MIRRHGNGHAHRIGDRLPRIRQNSENEEGGLLTGQTDLRDDWAGFKDVVRRQHPVIGAVGEGPSVRADALWTMLRARVPEVWYLTGHSLGGAVAMDVALLAMAENRAPAFMMTFAAPLCLGIVASGRLGATPGIDFARRGDPVPYLPEWDWMMRPRPLTMLGDWVFLPELEYHSMAGYRVIADSWLASATQTQLEGVQEP